MKNVTVFHNPACGTSRNVLGLTRHAGLEPGVGKLPPFTKEDGELFEDLGVRRA